jgi:hypothetical protein
MSITKKARKKKPTRTPKKKGELATAPAETTIIASEAFAPNLGEAVQTLLTGLAHGNANQVRVALHSITPTHASSDLPKHIVDILHHFHQAVWALKSDFGGDECGDNPITIPQILEDLARLRARAEEANRRTISLIEEQEQLVTSSERLVQGLEEILKSEKPDPEALGRELLEWKALTAAMRKLSVDMLCSQDFADLCGFILPTADEFMRGLDKDIRRILEHLHVELPKQQSVQAAKQSDIDLLLQQYGFTEGGAE